jgi:hypothetical protein
LLPIRRPGSGATRRFIILPLVTREQHLKLGRRSAGRSGGRHRFLSPILPNRELLPGTRFLTPLGTALAGLRDVVSVKFCSPKKGLSRFNSAMLPVSVPRRGSRRKFLSTTQRVIHGDTKLGQVPSTQERLFVTTSGLSVGEIASRQRNRRKKWLRKTRKIVAHLCAMAHTI